MRLRRIKIIGIAGLLVFIRIFFEIYFYESEIAGYLGQVNLQGCIVEEVDVRKDKVKYVILVDWGRVLVNGPRYPVYEYGNCLEVSGKLEEPGQFEDFDYKKYLQLDDIEAVMYRANVWEWEGGEQSGAVFYSVMYDFKNLLEGKLMQIFGEPNASLMAGLLLGSRKGISEELMLDFNTTGLTHIIAVSGFNITLVIGMVNGMLSFLSRRKKVVCAVVFITCFVILVGASAAVVRAGVMGGVAMMAVWFGRRYMAEIALWVAGFLMVMWNPLMLLYDVGFQLSFLATAGLIYVGPKLESFGEKFLKFVPARFGLRETVLMTLAAQSLALPIILINFKQLSLISLIANPLVLPFIPVIMLLGFVALITGFFWNFGGMVFAFAPDLLMKFMIFLVEKLAAVPLAAVGVGWFGWLMAMVYYGCFIRWLRRD